MKETVSIPGAGISYTDRCGKRQRKNGETGTRSGSNNIARWIIGLLALAAVLWVLNTPVVRSLRLVVRATNAVS